MVPMLLGGAIADRHPRGRIMVVAHLVSGANQAVMAALILTGRAALWRLVVSAAVSGGVGAFFGPAPRGVIRQLVDRELLAQANALLRLTQNVIKVAAPAVAGVLITVTGPGWAVAYDAVTFVVAAWILSRLRVTLTPFKGQDVLGRCGKGGPISGPADGCGSWSRSPPRAVRRG